MGSHCAVAANSSLPGSVCSQLSVQVALRDLEDNSFQWTFMTGHAVFSRSSRQTVWCLWKAPGHNGQGPHWPIIISICTKLQNKEHVIEALCRAKFKFPGCQKIHISKKWRFAKFSGDTFENMVSEKQLIPDGCGVKHLFSHGWLGRRWPCAHESLSIVRSSVTSTSKSYFPVKKQQQQKKP